MSAALLPVLEEGTKVAVEVRTDDETTYTEYVGWVVAADYMLLRLVVDTGASVISGLRPRARDGFAELLLPWASVARVEVLADPEADPS